MRYATIAMMALLATPALAQDGSRAEPLAPDQARSNIGQHVVVEGRAHVRDADGWLGVYVDLDHRGNHTRFAGYIPNENLAQFPHLREVEGRRVDIDGVVQIRKEGFPIIILTASGQLRPAG